MPPDDTILHQDAVEDVIATTMEELLESELAALSSQAAIANLPAPSATYVEAEEIARVARINLLTQVLRDASLLPT